MEYSANLAAYWCSKGHIGQVIDGALEIAFKQQTEIYTPGDGIFIPSGPEHEHRAVPLTSTATVWLAEDA